MATSKLFFCLLLLLVSHDAQGKTLCNNATMEYSKRGQLYPPNCPVDCGSSCHVICYGGGMLVITCNNFGVWDITTNFNCLEACPRPNVKNANETTKRSDGEVGKTMEFACHEGFVINGYEKITCLWDYTWDNQAPFCESRRYAHEVVKAMEIHFFKEMNDNNTRDLDLIILLDISLHERVRITVDLVKSLLLRCKENQRRIFYTLITYGREGHVLCTVCDIEQIIQVLINVAKHQHQPAGSNLGSGLSRIFTELLWNDHLSKQQDRILLLVTGQNPGISHNHQHWTKILRQDSSFKIFVVSLDNRVSKEEMKLLADQPWQNHYFHLEYSKIHEAVGNLSNNGSVIVNTTAHLVQQIKGSLNAGNLSRLFIYMEVGNSSETFTLVKQVTMNILYCMDQYKLEVFLNIGNVTEGVSVEAALGKLNDLQLSTLQKLATPNYILIKRGKDDGLLQIILFISSSGRIFDINIANGLKDLDCEIYAVGVGEQAKMQELQDLVSFPWYQHLVHASEGTVACDG